MKKLLAEIKSLVANERGITTLVLRKLREVEITGLHPELGYSSLFSFCVEELKYSEAEAHIRIQAMRLIREVPEAEQRIESGELSLSVAARAQSCIRREKIADMKALVDKLTGTSVREAEKKIAELYPDAPKKEKTKPLTKELTEIGEGLTLELIRLEHHERAALNHFRALCAERVFQLRVLTARIEDHPFRLQAQYFLPH